MCPLAWVSSFIDFKPLPVGDLLGLFEVPVSLAITYFIFRLGQGAEKDRQLIDHAIRYSDDCEREVTSLVQRVSSFLHHPTAGISKQAVQVEITTRMDYLRGLLTRAARFSKQEDKYFFDEYFAFFSAVSGTNSGIFSGGLPVNQGQVAQASRDIASAGQALVKKLDELRKIIIS